MIFLRRFVCVGTLATPLRLVSRTAAMRGEMGTAAPPFQRQSSFYTTMSDDASVESPHQTSGEQMTAHCDEELAPGLYVMATPIGNIEDLSVRAMRVLRSAAVIACEDTRTTRSLLRHARVSIRPEARLVSYTEHSHSKSNSKVDSIVKEAAGAPVALVSEAGTPCIADPGARLVELCHGSNVPLYAIPGPCSVVAAISLSGFPSDRFTFEGFLPNHRTARKAFLEEIKGETKTTVVFESPHRILDTLEACIEVFGEREACLVREMTKRHEQCVRGSFATILQNMLQTFSSIGGGNTKSKKKAKASPIAKGEIVIVISGAGKEVSEGKGIKVDV